MHDLSGALATCVLIKMLHLLLRDRGLSDENTTELKLAIKMISKLHIKLSFLSQSASLILFGGMT